MSIQDQFYQKIKQGLQKTWVNDYPWLLQSWVWRSRDQNQLF